MLFRYPRECVLTLRADRTAESVHGIGPTRTRVHRGAPYRRFEGMTQSDLGAELGVSQVQVSRLLGRIFADLRDRLTPVAAAA